MNQQDEMNEGQFCGLKYIKINTLCYFYVSHKCISHFEMAVKLLDRHMPYMHYSCQAVLTFDIHIDMM